MPPIAMILDEPVGPAGSGTAVPHSRRWLIAGAGVHQGVGPACSRNQVWSLTGPTTIARPEGMANMCG